MPQDDRRLAGLAHAQAPPPAGPAWMERALLAGDVAKFLVAHVLVRRGGGALRRPHDAVTAAVAATA